MEIEWKFICLTWHRRINFGMSFLGLRLRVRYEMQMKFLINSIKFILIHSFHLKFWFTEMRFMQFSRGWIFPSDYSMHKSIDIFKHHPWDRKNSILKTSYARLLSSSSSYIIKYIPPLPLCSPINQCKCW